jgi:hypothetical protein
MIVRHASAAKIAQSNACFLRLAPLQSIGNQSFVKAVSEDRAFQVEAMMQQSMALQAKTCDT